MTLVREPLSFPNAATRVAAVLGQQRMADLTRRSVSLVEKWCNPNGHKHPTIAQALALDAAYLAAGGRGSPYLETFSQLLDHEVGRQLACRLALTEELADVAQEFGQFMSAGLAVAQPDAGAREVHRAMGEFEDITSAMAVAGRRLSSFLPSGAGPGGETLGGAQ